MSRRTAPVYYDGTAAPWHSWRSSHRHSHGPSIFPIRLAPPTRPGSTPSDTLFEALDYARFDNVRRAVTGSSALLHATSRPRTALAASTAAPGEHLSVVDYALNNCRTWIALIDHCKRTGISVPDRGNLTFRERLAAMNLIILWLLSHPDVVLPSCNPLHTALACCSEAVYEKLLNLHAALARSVDARGKTPLHICSAIPSHLSPMRVVKLIFMLTRAGADVNAADLDGRTPMHDLVTSLRELGPTDGLLQRGRRSRTLGSVVPVVNALLVHGGCIYQENARGDSPLFQAMGMGIDFTVFVVQAKWVYEKICETPYARRCAQGGEGGEVTGVWGKVPEDVVMRILRMLSPRDAVLGIGATCREMRRMVVSEHLWETYKTGYSMECIRRTVQQRMARDAE